MKEAKKVKIIILHSLVLTLIIMVICMFQKVNSLQGTARIINYAGILRGATQRLVKLEMQGEKNEELLQQIDEIFYGLKYGSPEYELIQIKDKEFRASLKTWQENWNEVKSEIERIRIEGIRDSRLVELSEENFKLADHTVTKIEIYTQRLADTMQMIETFTLIDMLVILYMLVNEVIQRVQLSNYNKELSKKANLDLHTGLMNKGKCNELFADETILQDNVACMMYDLNNLKQVNDTLGHMEGDTLIVNFTNILKNTIPEGNFIGRYGGDEFIVVLYNSSEEQVKCIVRELQNNIEIFNAVEGRSKLSFAYGYDGSWNYKTCTMKMLLDKADHNMYLNKQNMKSKVAQIKYMDLLKDGRRNSKEVQHENCS